MDNLSQNSEYIPSNPIKYKSLCRFSDFQGETHKLRQPYKKWTFGEQLLFLEILEIISKSQSKPIKRCHRKIYEKISEFVKSRTAIQCKSHYRMLSKSTKKGTLQEIVDYMNKKLKVFQSLPTSSRSNLREIDLKQIKMGENQDSKMTITVQKTSMKVQIMIDMDKMEIW